MWPLKSLVVICAFVAFQIRPTSATFDSNSTFFPPLNATFNWWGESNTANNTRNVTKIVGGVPIRINKAPYQIALFRNNYFICGGSILSVDWIVTAAHCVSENGSYGVRAGSSNSGLGGIIRYVGSVVINAGFNPLSMDNDIAMLRLQRRLVYSRRIRPISLPIARSRIPAKLFVSGWGSTRYNGSPEFQLRGAEIRRVTRTSCRVAYQNTVSITNSMICATAPGTDACQGDSGGPLVNFGELYGIVSFGVACANPSFPGVYTNVMRHRQWIMNVARTFGGQAPEA